MVISAREEQKLIAIAFYLIIQLVFSASSEIHNLTLDKQIFVSDKVRKFNTTAMGRNEMLESKPLGELEIQHPVTGESAEMITDETLNKRGADMNQLGIEFTRLFDELWKFNNISLLILTNSDVDQNEISKQETRATWTDSLVADTSTSNTNNISTSDQIEQIKGSGNDSMKSTEANKTSEDGDSKISPIQHLDHQKPSHSYHKVTFGASNKQQQQQLHLSFASQFKIWLMKIHMRISHFLSILSRPIVDRFATARISSKQSTTVVTPSDEIQEANAPSREPSSKSYDDQVRQMEKRHISEEETTARANITTDSMKTFNTTNSCIELEPNTLEKCKAIELTLSANLNNSFPSTLANVEENCHRISYVLSHCWLEHLQYIRNIVVDSWNETLFSTSDFSLPSVNINRADKQRSDGIQSTICGTSPQEAQPIIDRIDWMWLNLCMDRKFRLDYVENLKCLSVWNQERARRICSAEYKRMQDFFSTKKESPLTLTVEGGKVASMEDSPINNSLTTSKSSNNSSVIDRTQDAALERDLEPKTHCCIFDMFLRCVHRQSMRDCGKPGSQFVVNFMARIGTDDMKYLCKRELRSSGRGKQTGTRRSNSDNNDRHPFIESIYCADRRIQNALYGTKNDDKVRFPGANVNVSPRPNTNRNDNRGPNSASYGSNSSSGIGKDLNSAVVTLFSISGSWIIFVIHSNIVLNFFS